MSAVFHNLTQASVTVHITDVAGNVLNSAFLSPGEVRVLVSLLGGYAATAQIQGMNLSNTLPVLNGDCVRVTMDTLSGLNLALCNTEPLGQTQGFVGGPILPASVHFGLGSRTSLNQNVTVSNIQEMLTLQPSVRMLGSSLPNSFGLSSVAATAPQLTSTPNYYAQPPTNLLGNSNPQVMTDPSTGLVFPSALQFFPSLSATPNSLGAIQTNNTSNNLLGNSANYAPGRQTHICTGTLLPNGTYDTHCVPINPPAPNPNPYPYQYQPPPTNPCPGDNFTCLAGASQNCCNNNIGYAPGANLTPGQIQGMCSSMGSNCLPCAPGRIPIVVGQTNFQGRPYTLYICPR
jgi:hypothetical protein